MVESFNLLEEPWLSCVDENNQLVHLNLVETINVAHHLRDLRSDLPIITGSLYLFLIAYISGIFRPKSDEEWEALWIQGKFSNQKIQAYNQRWRNRFDLFDPHHPFYQDPNFGRREKDIKNLKKGKSPEPKGLSGLLLHLSSGNNATLFDHSLDDLPRTYTAGETAQLLIMLQAYSLGGMSSASIAKDRYYKDAAFGRGILFLNKGQNLFETIMLNIFPEDFTSKRSTGDQPSWEVEDAFELESYSPKGLLDLMTWQSRRILLIPEVEDNSLVVRSLFSAPGHGIVDTYANPLYLNRITTDGKKQSIKPLRFQEGRSLWRDSTAILDVNSSNTESPISIKWSAHLEGYGIISKHYIQLNLYGMCTQPGQKKAYFYAHESFTAPVAYLRNPELMLMLREGLELAEVVRSNLYIATRELARFIVVPLHDQENVRVPGRDDTDPLLQHWNTEFHYWNSLEPAFYEFLTRLPETEQAVEDWEKAIRQSAWSALNYVGEQVGTAPSGLKARAKAERSLSSLLYRTFHPEGKE